MSSVTKLQSKGDYSKKILIPEGVAVLEAFGASCGHCKQLAPEYEKLASALPKASFFTFDVDAVPDIAQELGVSSMPTIIVFKDGDLVEKIYGNKPAQIKTAVEKTLG